MPNTIEINLEKYNKIIKSLGENGVNLDQMIYKKGINKRAIAKFLEHFLETLQLGN